MTRQETEQKIDELALEYHDTHDPEIPEKIFELAGRGLGNWTTENQTSIRQVRFLEGIAELGCRSHVTTCHDALATTHVYEKSSISH
jgi:hypothetical protein